MRVAAKLAFSPASPKVRHHFGAPPEATGASDVRTLMPDSKVLLIEPSKDGVFLIRYAMNGQFAGDTWHSTIDEAKDQAAYEFGEAVSAWKDVPKDVNDVVAFVTSTAD